MTRYALPYDILVVMVATGLMAALAPRSHAGPNEEGGGPITVEIHAHGARPLAKALDVLEERHDVAICYEDLYVEHDDELQDISDKTLRVARPNDDPGRVALPKFGTLVFEYNVDEDGRPLHKPLDLLRSLIDSYHGQGNIGRFEVASLDDVYLVQPTHYRSRDGQLVPYASILDFTIDLEAGNTTVHDAFEALAARLGKTLGRQVWLGSLPTNLFMSTPLPREVKGRSAKAWMVNVFASIERKLSWRLFYDPQNHAHALNVRLIKKSTAAVPPQKGRHAINRILELSIGGERPEADALRIVQQRCGWRIGYEDPMLTGYRSGWLRFGFAVDADLQPISQPQFIESLLGSFKAGAIPGKWRVEFENNRYHVVPIAHYSAQLAQEGNGFIPQDAVMDTRISIEHPDAPVASVLKGLCAQLTNASGRTVILGQLPRSMDRRTHLAAQTLLNRKARKCLDDLLSQVGNNISYYLYHDPINNHYRLELHGP